MQSFCDLREEETMFQKKTRHVTVYIEYIL